jgi:hypothetical protein
LQLVAVLYIYSEAGGRNSVHDHSHWGIEGTVNILSTPHFESMLLMTSNRPLMCILFNCIKSVKKTLNRSTTCITKHSWYIVRRVNRLDASGRALHFTASYLKPNTLQQMSIKYTLWFYVPEAHELWTSLHTKLSKLKNAFLA